MSFTISKERFLEEFGKVKSIIDIKKELSDQVFKKPYSKFLLINFDDILMREFFRSIKAFLTSVGEKEFSLLVIDPRPEEYFYQSYRKYPLIKFSIESTEDEFISVINKYPGGRFEGSVSVLTNRLVVYSESSDLFIYGERELELGIAVCADDKVEEAFVSSYGKERIFSVEGAVKHILKLVFLRRGVSQDIIDKLHLNYG